MARRRHPWELPNLSQLVLGEPTNSALSTLASLQHWQTKLRASLTAISADIDASEEVAMRWQIDSHGKCEAAVRELRAVREQTESDLAAVGAAIAQIVHDVDCSALVASTVEQYSTQHESSGGVASPAHNQYLLLGCSDPRRAQLPLVPKTCTASFYARPAPGAEVGARLSDKQRTVRNVARRSPILVNSPERRHLHF